MTVPAVQASGGWTWTLPPGTTIGQLIRWAYNGQAVTTGIYWSSRRGTSSPSGAVSLRVDGVTLTIDLDEGSAMAVQAAVTAEAAADAAQTHAGAAATSAGSAATSAATSAESADSAAQSETDAAAHVAAAQMARTGAETARDDATVSAGAAATSAIEAAASALATDWRRSLSARAALAPLLAPYDPADPLSGPVALWLADHYTPGAAGGPGRYPNLAGTGAELDLLEPAAAAARPTRLPFTGERFVHISGTTQNNVSTPDTADLDIAGDLDLRAEVTLDSLTSAAERFLAYKGGSPSRTWWFYVTALGTLQLRLSADGTTYTIATDSTATVPLGRQHLRVTWRQADGRVQYFTSPDGVAWTQLGPDRSIAIPSIFTGSDAPLWFGPGLGGRLHSSEIRNGINGPVVASWRARDMGQTGGSSGGRAWTIGRQAGNAAKAVVVDRTVTLLDGLDDYLEVPHDARLDPIGGALSVVHLYRVWGAPGATSTLVAKSATNSGPAWSVYRTTVRATTVRTNDDTAAVTDTDGTSVAVGTWRSDSVRLALSGLRASDLAIVAAPTSDGSPLRIGRTSAGTGGHSSQEWLGTAIFRRPLTDSEAESLTNALLGRPDVQAERIDIDALTEPTARSSPAVFGGQINAACFGNGYRQASSDGHWIEWAIDLSAGSWRIDLMHARGPSGPILRFTLDGVSLGTLDTYNAADAFNSVATLTFTTSSPGRKVLRIAVEGRNPANTTGYFARLQKLALTRTA